MKLETKDGVGNVKDCVGNEKNAVENENDGMGNEGWYGKCRITWKVRRTVLKIRMV